MRRVGRDEVGALPGPRRRGRGGTVDTRDLKSRGPGPCGFDSRRPHQDAVDCLVTKDSAGCGDDPLHPRAVSGATVVFTVNLAARTGGDTVMRCNSDRPTADRKRSRRVHAICIMHDIVFGRLQAGAAQDARASVPRGFGGKPAALATTGPGRVRPRGAACPDAPQPFPSAALNRNAQHPLPAAIVARHQPGSCAIAMLAGGLRLDGRGARGGGRRTRHPVHLSVHPQDAARAGHCGAA